MRGAYFSRGRMHQLVFRERKQGGRREGKLIKNFSVLSSSTLSNRASRNKRRLPSPTFLHSLLAIRSGKCCPRRRSRRNELREKIAIITSPALINERSNKNYQTIERFRAEKRKPIGARRSFLLECKFIEMNSNAV